MMIVFKIQVDGLLFIMKAVKQSQINSFPVLLYFMQLSASSPQKHIQ